MTSHPTEVWYMKSWFFKAGILGHAYLAAEGMLPDPDDLSKTHAKICSMTEHNPENVFAAMQGEVWNKDGHANDNLARHGVRHSSMSIGDVIVINGKTYMVDMVGFTELN